MNVVVSCAGQRRWSASYDGPRAMMVRELCRYVIFIPFFDILFRYIIIKLVKILFTHVIILLMLK